MLSWGESSPRSIPLLVQPALLHRSLWSRAPRENKFSGFLPSCLGIVVPDGSCGSHTHSLTFPVMQPAVEAGPCTLHPDCTKLHFPQPSFISCSRSTRAVFRLCPGSPPPTRLGSLHLSSNTWSQFLSAGNTVCFLSILSESDPLRPEFSCLFLLHLSTLVITLGAPR